MEKCGAKDKNDNNCRNCILDDSKFCVFHQYMNNYTDEMLQNTKLCNGCKKMYYFGDNSKTCDNCKQRGAQNKIKAKETVIKCAKENCKNKRSVENNYCRLHQLCLFENETKALNKKLCYNYIRGCRIQVDIDYTFSKCGDCLQIEREKDKKRRELAKLKNGGNVENNSLKTCTTCCKSLPMEQFIGDKQQITKTCFHCREQNKIQDEKRDREHRNELARINDAKPERIEVKKQWIDNNYEKVALKWMNYRQRKIEENTEGYLQKEKETAQRWRDNNPEKTKENNEYKKNSKEINYSNYVRNAGYKNLEFTVTYNEFVNIVETPCEYCGILQEKGFNGIDRKDQTEGYIIDNCVSCCKICNYMKGSTDNEVFIKRVEHILTFRKLIDGQLYPECFASHKSVSYARYRKRALEKQLVFLITPDDFNNIIKNDCFMCGKQNDEFHKNGIDRTDSDKGYLLDNIQACCCECNYMKKDYVFDDIMNKFMLIYENHKNDFGLEEETLQNTMILNDYVNNIVNNVEQPNNRHIVINTNKKSKEEIKEANKIYKQKQRERLKERYGDEEYKKLRAKEIAQYRSEKKK